MTEDGYYVVNIQTHIYGGGDVWKVIAKTKREILAENTTDPEFFLTHKKYTGKVYTTEGTNLLQDGVAYVDTTDDAVLKIGHGGGYMLGGLDAENIYYPISKEDYDKRMAAQKQYDKIYLFSGRSEEAIEYADDADKDKLREYHAENKTDAYLKSIGDKRLYMQLSDSNVSGRFDVFNHAKYLDNCKRVETIEQANALTKYSRIDEDTLKREIKYWNEWFVLDGLKKQTIKSIVYIYVNGGNPRVIELKNGRYLLLAQTSVTDGQDNWYEMIEMRRLHTKLEKMQDELQRVIKGETQESS